MTSTTAARAALIVAAFLAVPIALRARAARPAAAGLGSLAALAVFAGALSPPQTWFSWAALAALHALAPAICGASAWITFGGCRTVATVLVAVGAGAGMALGVFGRDLPREGHAAALLGIWLSSFTVGLAGLYLREELPVNPADKIAALMLASMTVNMVGVIGWRWSASAYIIAQVGDIVFLCVIAMMEALWLRNLSFSFFRQPSRAAHRRGRL